LKEDKIDFMDLVTGSFLAAAFVWAWINASRIIDVHQAAFPIQAALSMLQYAFFVVGGLTASYIVSRKTRRANAWTGLKIGIGAWIISSTLFLPLSETITIPVVLMTLVAFLAGSHLGIKLFQRRNRKEAISYTKRPEHGP